MVFSRCQLTDWLYFNDERGSNRRGTALRNSFFAGQFRVRILKQEKQMAIYKKKKKKKKDSNHKPVASKTFALPIELNESDNSALSFSYLIYSTSII